MKDGNPGVNPKDAVAGTKVPLDLLSPVAMAHWAAGQHAGNAKYGLVNYRVAGASARVYLGGALRHIQRYLAGQRDDPVDGAHNLGMAMANLAIVLDCEAAGTLNDDRPYPVPLDATYAEVERVIAASNERYKDRKPKHYTIADAQETPALKAGRWIPNAGQKPWYLPEEFEVKLRTGEVMDQKFFDRLDWSIDETEPNDGDILQWRPL